MIKVPHRISLSLLLFVASLLVVSSAAALTVTGTRHADLLRGSVHADRISGGRGADQLFGGRGNDTLIGGDGVDMLYGGYGADHLDAVDGLRDHVIDGGPGFDVCREDTMFELNQTFGCEIILGPKHYKQHPHRLQLLATSSLRCSRTVNCWFSLSGNGAQPVATASGIAPSEPGITVRSGGVSMGEVFTWQGRGGHWWAKGYYSCGHGTQNLIVTVDLKTIHVPIECPTRPIAY